MTRWDTDNLNAAHTQRELDQEFGPVIDCEIGGGNVFADLGFENADLMALQSDNKGLRDRIEQIERELAEQVNKKVGYYNDWMAEKALAEFTEAIILKIINGPQVECIPDNDIQADIAAYRKARGL